MLHLLQKPGIGQNIALHASPAANYPAILISAFSMFFEQAVMCVMHCEQGINCDLVDLFEKGCSHAFKRLGVVM